MNPLSYETNARGSLKKFLVDSIGDAHITFDRTLSYPDTRERGEDAVTWWVNVVFGEMGRDALADFSIDLYVCTRQDAEGVLLSEKSDLIFSLLTDSSKTDGMKRIPFYDVSSDPWTELTAMVVQYIYDSPVFDITLPEDETKVKMLTVLFRWGAAI